MPNRIEMTEHLIAELARLGNGLKCSNHSGAVFCKLGFAIVQVTKVWEAGGQRKIRTYTLTRAGRAFLNALPAPP